MGSGLYALEELLESGSGRQARRFRPQAHQIAAIQSGTPLAEITLLSTHFHKYGDVCWERDGAQIEARPRLASPIRKRHRIYAREY